MARYVGQNSRWNGGGTTYFSRYLAAPPIVQRYYDKYGKAIGRLADAQVDLYLSLLCDLAAEIWGPCPREVSDAELAEHGVGVSEAPEWFD